MTGMDSKGGYDESKVEKAKNWLEGLSKKGIPGFPGDEVWKGGRLFDFVCFGGLRIAHAGHAHVLCCFHIPPHLTDAYGNWHAGAITTVIDNVGASAIMTVTGLIPISVEFDISYFAPAKANDEVEIDARVVDYRGILTSVAVEIRKKGDGRLVALGRQWMATTRPSRLRSKM